MQRLWKGVGIVKFKVGDKVRVREDLEEDKWYDRQVFVDGMRKHCGKVMEIKEVWNDSYILKEDEEEWAFTDEMLEPIEDPLVKKIEERNSKPVKMILGENLLNDNDPIKPSHYRKGEIDLFESWYRTYPFNEFKAGMQMIAERYMKRDKHDRVEDIKKSVETLTRLKEYEKMEKSKKLLSEFK